MNQDSWDETILSLAPKTLPPLSTPLPTDLYERAKAVYYLLDTTRNSAGTDWSEYIKARVAADKQMRLTAPLGNSGEGGQRYLEVVRDAVYDVLKGALSQGQWEKVARGVVVTDLDVEIDRNGGYGVSGFSGMCIPVLVHVLTSRNCADQPLHHRYTYSLSCQRILPRPSVQIHFTPGVGLYNVGIYLRDAPQPHHTSSSNASLTRALPYLSYELRGRLEASRVVLHRRTGGR
jgi:hypothetical protein